MSDENGSEPKKNEVGEGDLESVTGGCFNIEKPVREPPICGNDGTEPPWNWPTPEPMPFPGPLPCPVILPAGPDPEVM